MASAKTIQQHWQDAQDAFARLEACSRVNRKRLPKKINGKGGVYVFFDHDGSPLYVGRGRDVRQRILQHSRPSIKDGPLAWLLARDETKRFTDYTSKSSRKALLGEEQFVAALKRAKERIDGMMVAFVVEEDDTTQCLLEIYAAVKLDARHNSFRTVVRMADVARILRHFGERCVPYFSPIHVRRVHPLKSGNQILEVDFVNVLYAEGVQSFSGMRLQVLAREENYLVAKIHKSPSSGRVAVVSHIEFAWLEACCPAVLSAFPPTEMGSPYASSISTYLDFVFLQRRAPGASPANIDVR